MIEPIPQVDDAEGALQARPVDDDTEERDTLPETRSDNSDAAAGDLSDQKLSVSVQGDGAAAALADRGFWPIWQSNSVATQRSFIDDMASLNEPYRPNS